MTNQTNSNDQEKPQKAPAEINPNRKPTEIDLPPVDEPSINMPEENDRGNNDKDLIKQHKEPKLHPV